MGELGLKRFLHTSINLTNSLLEIFITYSFYAASREFLDFGLENVLMVKGNKDFKMAPMPIPTKWLAADQRAHNSRSVFSTHMGNMTYFTWLSYINFHYQNAAWLLQKPKEQTAVLHLTNRTLPLLWHQTLYQSKDCTLALQNGLCFNSPVLTTP